MYGPHASADNKQIDELFRPRPEQIDPHNHKHNRGPCGRQQLWRHRIIPHGPGADNKVRRPRQTAKHENSKVDGAHTRLDQAALGDSGADKSREKWVRFERAGFKLRVILHSNKPGVSRNFNDLGQNTVG